MYGLGFANTFSDAQGEPDYASMDPLEAALAYGAAHPGDMVTDADRAAAGGYRPVQTMQGAGQGITAWLKNNTTAVYIGAAALAAMAVLKGRR